MKKIILTSILSLFAICCFAEERMIFKGVPQIKQISLSKKIEKLSNEEAIDLICMITKEGDKYYWSSRENVGNYRFKVELIPAKSGECYITFIATNGTGYIKIRNKESPELCKDADYGYEKYDYVEHLSIGFTSITYYGVER